MVATDMAAADMHLSVNAGAEEKKGRVIDAGLIC
jgi:hypothetical protein